MTLKLGLPSVRRTTSTTKSRKAEPRPSCRRDIHEDQSSTMPAALCNPRSRGLLGREDDQRGAAVRHLPGHGCAPDADRIAADDDAKRTSDHPDATTALALLAPMLFTLVQSVHL